MIHQHVLRDRSYSVVLSRTESYFPSVCLSVSTYMSHDQYTQRHSPDASLPGRACFLSFSLYFPSFSSRNHTPDVAFHEDTHNSQVEHGKRRHLHRHHCLTPPASLPSPLPPPPSPYPPNQHHCLHHYRNCSSDDHLPAADGQHLSPQQHRRSQILQRLPHLQQTRDSLRRQLWRGVVRTAFLAAATAALLWWRIAWIQNGQIPVFSKLVGSQRTKHNMYIYIILLVLIQHADNKQNIVCNNQ